VGSISSTIVLKRHLHKTQNFFVDILRVHHPEMVIILAGAWYLGDLDKTEIVVVGLVERKCDIDEIFPQSGDVGHPGFRCQRNHTAGCMHRHLSNSPIAFDEVPEESNRVFTLSGKEIRQLLLVAGMSLIAPNKLLTTDWALPHATI
jgi:hypothetical protein